LKVVYNSYNGRFSDSPRALYETLRAQGIGDEHVWLQDPHHAATFPPDTRTVAIATQESVAALESADLLISNTHIQLDDWAKPAGATYLQTWHGTPLKRIHRAAVSIPEPSAMDALDADIARWDFLVTPSRAGTGLLRSAFDYTGRILETGYPRNDALNAGDRHERRHRVRLELGLSEADTAVLYAPTYRDDDVIEREVPFALDPVALVDRLGDGYRMLLRRHYFLAQQGPFTGDDRIVEVSAHPDAADLYLAADVLITDYSSVIFDFAVTGKPILLFAYDLEHYRDRLRGFTLDLEVDMPGPVLYDQDQLAEALLDLPALVASYAERYTNFRGLYCHLDDGHATERVVAQLRTLRVAGG